MSDSEAVERYIESRRNNLKSADAIRGELVEIQALIRHMPYITPAGEVWQRFLKIESILDGLSSGPR